MLVSIFYIVWISYNRITFTVITYLCIYLFICLYCTPSRDAIQRVHFIELTKESCWIEVKVTKSTATHFLLVTFCSLLITFARCSLLFIVARYYSLQITVKYNSCKLKKKKKEKKEGLSVTKLHPRYFPCKFLRFW